MRIAVVIPTYQRIEKLQRCLASLNNQTYKDFFVVVHCDNNDLKTWNWLDRQNVEHLFPNICITRIMAKTQVFVIGAWNRAFECLTPIEQGEIGYYDAFAWIVDDVELYPDYLEKCVQAMKNNFPDLDGVIGTSQECPGHPEYTYKVFGQVLLGRKFVERYKEVDYKVCCPNYKHFFQDEEMWTFATKLDKFFYCKEAILKHYHPGFIKKEIDETHPLVRGIIAKQDRIIYKKRIESGLLWGENWTLVE